MKHLQTFFTLALFTTIVYAQPKNYKGWKAGVSRVKITPEQPLWMAGYANRTHPSEGTLVDLWVKALALEDEEGKQAVLITADLVGIPKALSDCVRNQLESKYHLTRSQILINTSHTHSGPVLTNALLDIYPVNLEQQQKIDEYTNQLGEKMVRLVGEALHALQLADLYSGNGVTRFQVNRRNNDEATLSRQTELKGPNDYSVPAIKVVSKTGKLLAITFGYACHNTVLSGYKFSGDYAGFAQLELEKAYPGVTAMFTQGCGANQNPLPRRTVALAQQYGQELAAAVTRVLSEDMKALAPQLKTAYAEIKLPLNSPTSKAELSKIVEMSGENYQKRWAARLLKKLNAGDSLITSYPYPVEVWKLGDQSIFVLSGETVIEYAIQLKRVFGEDIFVFGYSNDVMAYVPTAAILREGGYEGASSQMVYGLPSTWASSIETDILYEAQKLAAEVGVSQAEAKIN
ncbi:neutral/alkaline non-lysosomal ceramidase N-terminal domain-containing protein [Segetibacter koreensis]|uniref:neutral/alkaline non-lysosomal ceramidase N-terminal domain-containing protein n=1 Tax=Segetibacter koreensis TaxID=398037 RepID=UPI00037F135F|nr:neutral/alkaline non-lysosomal ceramidase N-terminal domain-containing protein [Segetibacter koreensis]